MAYLLTAFQLQPNIAHEMSGWLSLYFVWILNFLTSLLQLLHALDADSTAKNMQLASRFQDIDDVIGDDNTFSLVWSRDREATRITATMQTISSKHYSQESVFRILHQDV